MRQSREVASRSRGTLHDFVLHDFVNLFRFLQVRLLEFSLEAASPAFGDRTLPDRRQPTGWTPTDERRLCHRQFRWAVVLGETCLTTLTARQKKPVRTEGNSAHGLVILGGVISARSHPGSRYQLGYQPRRHVGWRHRPRCDGRAHRAGLQFRGELCLPGFR